MALTVAGDGPSGFSFDPSLITASSGRLYSSAIDLPGTYPVLDRGFMISDMLDVLTQSGFDHTGLPIYLVLWFGLVCFQMPEA